MIDTKWTGTDFDRREMRTLNLQQVVRVSVLADTLLMLLLPLTSLTTVTAQLR